ncbi:MAG TPA: ABC transporter permease [Opitutaceae bacterium]|nr:ABC transporter permease [Opitutaceae bacterium]
MQATLPVTAASAGARRPTWRAWLCLAPMIAWLVLFAVAPLGILLVYSFCQRDDLGRIVFAFSWENYVRVFEPRYLLILGRSIGYAAATTLGCLVLAYPTAYYMARREKPWRDWLLVLVMIPFWTSFLIRTYAWIQILKSEGLLNSVLKSVHLISAPIDWLYTPTAVLIGLIYTFLPFMILPIFASAEKLETDLIEAAHDLGAGPLRVFSTVIIPLTWPGVAAGTMLVFVPTIGMFAVTDLLGGAQVPLIGNVIQNQFLQARNWPFGAALGVVFTLLFAVSYAALQRPRRWERKGDA